MPERDTSPETLALLIRHLRGLGLLVVAVDVERGLVTVAAPQPRSVTNQTHSRP